VLIPTFSPQGDGNALHGGVRFSNINKG